MVLLEHADGLFSYALILTRNVHEAEDLVQETYLRAIQGMERLREDGNAKAWLYAILRNIRLNQLRQQRTRPTLLELDADEKSADLIAETAKDPHALYVSKVEKEQVHEALEQLSEEFREIILLREFAELSYQEIATVLGCAQGTVMSRLARARQKLRTLLSPHRAFHPDDKNHSKERSIVRRSSFDVKDKVVQRTKTGRQSSGREVRLLSMANY